MKKILLFLILSLLFLGCTMPANTNQNAPASNPSNLSGNAAARSNESARALTVNSSSNEDIPPPLPDGTRQVQQTGASPDLPPPLPDSNEAPPSNSSPSNDLPPPLPE